jgi:hypothetical protein
MTPSLGDSVEVLATPGTQMDGTAGQYGILRALVLEDDNQVMAVVLTAAGNRLTVPVDALAGFPVNRRDSPPEPAA